LHRDGFLIAAVFACGEGTLLGHRTGVVHWGLLRSASPAIHVIVQRKRKPVVEGVTVHLTRQLTDADRAVVRGIPVTSLARTLVDFAGVARPGELIEAIEQAERLRIFDLNAVNEVLTRSRGRRGAKALRAALKELHGEEPPDLKSTLERDFRSYCKSRDLPIPSSTSASKASSLMQFGRTRNSSSNSTAAATTWGSARLKGIERETPSCRWPGTGLLA